MAKTTLKKLFIEKFRALENVPLEFGNQITVICGKNGTSKSSILGIAAQIFSFDVDHVSGDALNYKTIAGDAFTSKPSEHFRISVDHDRPKEMLISFELHDGYTDQDAEAKLSFSYRKNREGDIINLRPVVRNNNTIPEKENTSRNFIHPVIFLSLKRLMPIAQREKYETADFDYITANRAAFLALTNQLLNKDSTDATSTAGSIKSVVAHGEKYNHQSVSAGEDNAGQIIMALMSFRKLKEEYPEYKGGLLLIDEVDAALFPAAQISLIEILRKECAALHLQVVMTSHSPTLIEHTYQLSQQFQRNFKTIYLSDSWGPIKSMGQMSWPQIYADLMIETVKVSDEVSLPKVNVYFEDHEGYDFFKALMVRSPANKVLTLMEDITLGCANYKQLISKGIPDFSKKGLVILDGDVEGVERMSTVVKLPTVLPPDQLLFEYLYNFPADHDYWVNKAQLSRPIFLRAAQSIVEILGITYPTNLAELIAAYHRGDKQRKEKLRDLFKTFYKHREIAKVLSSRDAMTNPWKRWVKENEDKKIAFRSGLSAALFKVLRDGHGVDTSLISTVSAE